MTVISGRPLSCTGTLPLCTEDTGRYFETILNVMFQQGHSEVMKTLKFTDYGPTFSVKIESVPLPLTFTLIWCEYSARTANSTSSKSSGRGKRKAECTPLIVFEAIWVGSPSMIHKPNCLKEIIREITWTTGVYTPVEVFNVEVQRRFYRSVSDKLPVSSCSIIVSVHNKHSPINKKSQVYSKSGCRVEEWAYFPNKCLLVLIHSST